jgi:hypothetical protein
LRRNGPAGLAFAVLRHTVYCQVALIEKNLAREIPDVSSEIEFEVMRLTPEDVNPYCRHRPGASPEEILRRLERGSLCYAAWDGGRILASVWYHPREAWIEDLDRRFELPPDAVYVYDGHTNPEVRGRRVAAAQAATTWSELQKQGFRRGIAFVLAGNRSSDRARRKAGWRRFGVAGYVRLGRWRLEFIRVGGCRTRWRRRALRPAARRPELPPLEPTDALAG